MGENGRMHPDSYSPDELDRMADDLAEFLDAFNSLIADKWVSGGLAGTKAQTVLAALTPDERTQQVAQLAGRAEQGIVVADAFFLLPGHDRPTNVVSAWPLAAFQGPLTVADVRTNVARAEGSLRRSAERRRAEEATWAGKVARIFAFPRRVRELAGYAASSRAGRTVQRSTAAAMGVFGVLFFGVISSVIAAGIIRLFQTML